MDEEDQVTHLLSLEDELEGEDSLRKKLMFLFFYHSFCFTDIFKPDPDFLENKDKYKTIKEDILGSSSEEESGEEGSEDEEGVGQRA